ncbi:MAG TPA: MFS transporter, partial [Spirochaetia bacterium]|nr:MFS transporter [Spirochaetia bacterium]
RNLLLVLFLGVLMGALDIAIVGPALPAIRDSFKVGDRAVAWIFTIYVLFNLVGSALMSKLSDRYGRKRVYLWDLAFFAIGSLVVAASPDLPVLLAGRAIQGMSAGGLWPIASAVVGESFPAEKRGPALGMIGAVFGIAFLVGPPLGGLLLLLSWHWLFIINIPLAALIIILALRTIPDTKSAAAKPFDVGGMALFGLMLAAFAFGINQIDTADFPRTLLSPMVWPFILAALAGIPFLAAIERRASDPVLHPVLFTNRQIVLGGALSLAAGFAEGALVFIPAFTVAAFGVSLSNASFLMLPPVLATAIASPVWGRLLGRLGSRTVIAIGLVLSVFGLLLVGFRGTNFAAYIVGGAGIGFGLSALLGAPIRYIMINEAPLEHRTVAQGLITISTSVGQLVSGALVGAVAASFGGGVSGYSLSYRWLGALFVLFFFVGLFLKSRAAERRTLEKAAAASGDA